MFSIDDRAGNVMTTVALFGVAAAVLYLARGAFFILLLSLLFAYLLEPVVTFIERHSFLGRGNRTWAIAQAYLIGLLVLGGLGYQFGPHIVGQIKGLNQAVPQILQSLTDEKAAAALEAKYGVNAAQHQRIHEWLARNHETIATAFERGASSVAYVAESAVWLLAVPILAIFILLDGRESMTAMFQSVGRRQDHTVALRILRQVDTMLANYVRSQLALAGLSFVFYSAAMLLLKFPYAIALGLLGGVLEFIPVVGWIAFTAVALTIGFLTHGHWVWMALLIVLWRLVQNYVFSPRIMGDNLQLQPLTVLFALMVGGQVAGIAGVFVSVPLAAVLKIVWLGNVTAESSPATVPDRPGTQLKL